MLNKVQRSEGPGTKPVLDFVVADDCLVNNIILKNDIVMDGNGPDLLYEINKKLSNASRLSEMVQKIVEMTQKTLSASASSLLLLDEKTQELFFEVAEGKVGSRLKQTRLSTKEGIAGWVVSNHMPLIVNDVADDSRFNNNIDTITGFSTRSVMCVPLVIHRNTIGVLEVLNKQDMSKFNQTDLERLLAVAPTAAMATENTMLQQAVLDGYKRTIKALAAAIDAKDPYTCGHSQRVMKYALLMGISFGFPKHRLDEIEYAGILHDIGKIGIPGRILCKPRLLTPKEFKIIQEHPLMGANIIKEIPFLEEARRIVLYHHERYDGSGYPSGLRGENIPIGARILSVADAFDTMTTERAYQKAITTEQALKELNNHAGTQFCPEVVHKLSSLISDKKYHLPLQSTLDPELNS